MAANPVLMFASVCCGIMGISFFFGFYFGMVEKDIENNREIDALIARVSLKHTHTHTHTHTQETITKLQNSQKQQVINETCTVTNIHRTAEETCNILTQTTTPRNCAQKHSCGDCTPLSFPSCQTRMNNVGSVGYCDNGGTCCLSETYVILSIYLFAYAYIDT